MGCVYDLTNWRFSGFDRTEKNADLWKFSHKRYDGWYFYIRVNCGITSLIPVVGNFSVQDMKDIFSFMKEIEDDFPCAYS